MHRVLLLILSITVFTFAAWSQEAEERAAAGPESPDAVTTTEASDEAAAAPENDAAPEPVVDDEFYQDVDDKDFRPSEDIPADQSIPFPSDI